MLLNYLKIALKVLLRRKGHTAISLFGITFTLMALVLVAALIDHAVGPVGPERRQDRILVVGGEVVDRTGENPHGLPIGPRLMERFFADLPGAETLSIFLDLARAHTFHGGSRVQLGLKLTDAAFWRILTFTFVEGGPYSPDDLRDARPVAVISETTRSKLFDGAPALGRTLEIDGQRLRVVGVVRDASPLRTIPWADVWAPLTISRQGVHLEEISPYANGILLAADRAHFPRLKQEVSLRAARWLPSDPRRHGRARAELETRFEKILDDADEGLFGRNSGDSDLLKLSRVTTAALAISLLFMLLPAVNLINLNVSRILERASEIGVRKSFGASSRTLVGQFVVENVVLTLLGGLLALLLSALALHALGGSGLFGAEPLRVSGPVFAAGLLLAGLFGLVSGVYPAWKMSRMHPLAALRGAGR
jgi:putative ABC transport system permease protein